MTKLHARIMVLLDKHLDGKYLTWETYDNLINMILKEGAISERKYQSKIKKLEAIIKNLKESLCSSLSKELTKQEKQHSPKKSKNGIISSTNTLESLV